MKPPKLTPVKSSNIQSLGHDTHGLWVRFKGGGLYRYPDVAEKVFQDAVSSESPGKFFAKEIRGQYRHVLVNE